ncbi:helix-turn-helix domain-containing protein [Mammaliicoccus sciuri]|uniref:Helix-turn-helix domain-containing protein n=1 Tax=Mammaliicoccus sciuri TaxID=1296 RepID=A0AAW5LN39_MAMSC|nr:helix-turn-helix transcriptional regulator [Mammaliicoccus sciuri]MCQ9303093.1 helix-turn-helix domain-containing protein [Mammaliicoccus sciuri]
MNAVEVGKRIISLREEHDLGQKDLAQILSVRVSSVSNWECGRNKPNKVIINKIKKQFNYDISNENSNNNNNLGKKIKTIRLERGLNMREFGEKINNSSDSLVSRWEKGHSIPRQDRLKKIADFANITVEELMQETEESPHISVGRTIRSIRLKNGMNLEEFGNMFGVSKSNVSKWENGKQLPNKLRLKKIAKLGNITVDELLDITNYQELYELEKERNSLLEQEIQILKEQLNLLNKKDTSTKVSK